MFKGTLPFNINISSKVNINPQEQRVCIQNSKFEPLYVLQILLAENPERALTSRTTLGSKLLLDQV